ncbi:response regulator [Uniformispora flossi]|uniref:response regulator n=1 Tax=Uniformispora flossi TaxID=3390723 RepID=UPI003C2E0D99
MTISVLVADDQALVRVGLCGIIDAAEGFTLVGEAATGRAAVDLARRALPDVALMDIRMPDLDGLAATRELTGPAGVPGTRVLILTTFGLDEYIFEALRGGASGFLLKDTPPAELLAAIRVVAAGDALLSPAVTRRLITEFAATDRRPASPHSTLAGITPRESEVLALIAAGLTNNEIAARLHVGEGTVKTHVGHLLTKLRARDRVHLVIIAYRNGMAVP